MSGINEKILSIEKNLDLNKFQFKGENVWPIIRMSIYLSSTKSTSSDSSFWKSAKFLFSGSITYFRQLLKSLLCKSKYDCVLITTSHYKVEENGKTYDRIIDPVLNYLKSRDKKVSVWEFTGKFTYDKNISYRSIMRPVHGEIYFLSIVNKLVRTIQKQNKLGGDISKLNLLLKQNEIKFTLDAAFMRKLENIFFQADFFYREMAEHGVKNLFVVCYYDVKCFAAVLAANRLGIGSVDLQHGVQGESHMGYAQWPDVARSSNLLPTHFYVWDDNSLQTIYNWKNDNSKILLGSNKWVLDRARKVSNDIILLTLQPIVDSLPDFVIKIIQQYNGVKKWYIRLHPRQLGEVGRIETILRNAGISDKTEVRKASFPPLTSLLIHTSLHVTFFSSVAIEASYYNIPTYFLSEEHARSYRNYLDKRMIFCYPLDSLNEVVDMVADEYTGDVRDKNDRIGVLDSFIDGTK